MCLGEESYTIERFDNNIWGVESELCFSCENFKNSKLLRLEFGKMTSLRELFYFSTSQGDMLASPHIPQVPRMFWSNPYASSISRIAMFIFILTFTQGRAKNKCGGTCWRSLMSIIDHHFSIYIFLISIIYVGILL